MALFFKKVIMRVHLKKGQEIFVDDKKSLINSFSLKSGLYISKTNDTRKLNQGWISCLLKIG